MSVAFPRESADYRLARERLLEQEIELRRMTEVVAAARRQLPPGGEADDYVFAASDADGTPIDVRLSELFAPGRNSLVLYSFMFPRDPGDERPAQLVPSRPCHSTMQTRGLSLSPRVCWVCTT